MFPLKNILKYSLYLNNINNKLFINKNIFNNLTILRRSVTKLLPVSSKLKEESNGNTNNNNNIKKEFSSNIIKEAFANKPILTYQNWKELRQNVIENDRNINNKNIDAIIIGHCTTNLQLNLAKSYMNYLKADDIQPNLGTLGRFIKLYYLSSANQELSTDDRKDILQLYDHIINKYMLLDPNTSENLIYGLCATDKWKQSLKLIENIKQISTPSINVYCAIIETSFKNDDTVIGWRLLNEMIKENRLPKCNVYIEWLNYAYRNNRTTLKNANLLLQFISENQIMVTKLVTEKLKEVYGKLKYFCNYTSIPISGRCSQCKVQMNNISITDIEYDMLKTNFLDKVLIRNNVFQRSSPNELRNFEKFIKNTNYNVVIDGLNIAYASGNKKSPNVYAKMLESVVRYFVRKNKKILVLGRIHMRNWPSKQMDYISMNASTFLTDDMSQDDPFLLYATLNSGRFADFVSRDLMRQHAFHLGPQLKQIFRRWQQEHQYFLDYVDQDGITVLKEPIKFNINAQQIGNSWHIPYREEYTPTPADFFDVPSSWLCISDKSQ